MRVVVPIVFAITLVVLLTYSRTLIDPSIPSVGTGEAGDNTGTRSSADETTTIRDDFGRAPGETDSRTALRDSEVSGVSAGYNVMETADERALESPTINTDALEDDGSIATTMQTEQRDTLQVSEAEYIQVESDDEVIALANGCMFLDARSALAQLVQEASWEERPTNLQINSEWVILAQGEQRTFEFGDAWVAEGDRYAVLDDATVSALSVRIDPRRGTGSTVEQALTTRQLILTNGFVNSIDAQDCRN